MGLPDTLVLATNNPAKLVELRRVLAEAAPGTEIRGLADFPRYPEPAETARTFADNALIKARAAVEHTGLAALADDSGLEVDVLNGMPGVRSSRWAGPACDDAANLQLVLDQVDDVPDAERTARFVCVIALVLPVPVGVTDPGAPVEYLRRGEMPGRLIRSPRGDHGFGYDPIFVPIGEDRTTAEMSAVEKDAISHRGRALRATAALIGELRAGKDPSRELTP